MAIAAFAFTSCEDVPEPYSIPTEGGNETVVIEPEGSGTAADPYNVTAALDYVNSLAADVESADNIYIKGKVVSIGEEFSTQYGNATYYISDDGTKNKQFYVYRSLYLGNKKFTSGDTQIQEGDEVVICGKVVNYKGTTPETVLNKSYLYSLNGQGGSGGDDNPQPSAEASGSGTQADPYNSVAANNLANGLADNAKSDNVYIKGKVVSIKEQFGTQYGNATFYISDDGTEAGQFYVFRALYLGNQKYTSGDLLKEGDDVVVYGKVTKYVSSYGTTPETVQNEAFVYSLNGKTEGGNDTPQPSGDYGTADAPITVAQALTIIDGLGDGKTTDSEAYIKGKIKSITEVSTQYGNATYLISDDGADNELTVFRGKYLGGESFTAADQIKVGDEVIVKGKLQKYVKDGTVTPEVATGSSIYSLNGETGSDTPTPQPSDVAETGDNGDFEQWADGLPVNWKPASSAGSATLAQSTDAHGGSYSVKVSGSNSGNKRLGYKELQLNAGTYAITFYAKALAEGGTLNPGIVPVTNGSVGTYKYTGYIDNVSTSEWQKVEATVEVSAAGTYCFVVMNQKKDTAVDILIDDFTVTMGGKEVIK